MLKGILAKIQYSQVRNENTIQRFTEKSFAEQKPQSKVISITRVQTNELLVASQQVASCEPKSCKLRVYHITIQLIVSLSHFELQASEVMTCQLMLRLWRDFSRKRLNLSRDKCMTLKNMPTFLKSLYSKILRFSMMFKIFTFFKIFTYCKVFTFTNIFLKFFLFSQMKKSKYIILSKYPKKEFDTNRA